MGLVAMSINKEHESYDYQNSLNEFIELVKEDKLTYENRYGKKIIGYCFVIEELIYPKGYKQLYVVDGLNHIIKLFEGNNKMKCLRIKLEENGRLIIDVISENGREEWRLYKLTEDKATKNKLRRKKGYLLR